MNNQLLRVLSIRSFLVLWMAEIFSQIAFNMMNFILILVAFELTNSNTAVSGIVLSFTIPAILFGFYAGVYVDKKNKRTILVWTNVLRALLLCILGAFHTNIFFLYVLTIFITIITQFFIPAETPIIPLLVKEESLLSANALFGMGIYGSVFVAYALSGPLYLLLKDQIFFFLGFLFFIASIFSFLIRIPDGKKQKKIAVVFNLTFRDEVKALFAILSKTKVVYQAMFLLAMSQIIILILATIGPGYGLQVLGIPVEKFPLVFITPAALGMFLGAITLGNFFHTKGRGKIAMIGVFLSGFSILLLPYGSKVASRDFVTTINAFLPMFFQVNILHIMTFLAFLLGTANAFIFVPSNTVLQEKTSDAYRGKVYGLLNALVGLVSFIPIILVGGFADLIGVSKVLTGIGCTIIAIGMARLFFEKIVVK